MASDGTINGIDESSFKYVFEVRFLQAPFSIPNLQHVFSSTAQSTEHTYT